MASLETEPAPTDSTNYQPNGETTSIIDVEPVLSPTSELRRSTRVSAKRAQMLIKDDTDEAYAAAQACDENNMIMDVDTTTGLRSNTSRKRLAVEAIDLDVADPHFAIQMDADGDVIVLSDDSEVSSLNEIELQTIRSTFEQSKNAELTPEQKSQRELLIRQLEVELRREEAKLLMLKKIRLSQIPKDQKNISGSNAYRPPVAHRDSPSAQKTGSQYGNIQTAGKTLAHSAASLSTSSKVPTQASLAQQKEMAAQKAAAAKTALRRDLEKVLLQVPTPRPTTTELNFIPNPNQPDFLVLHAVDLCVEKLMKQKRSSSHKEPYRCSQCDTDFTPLWRLIPGDNPRLICDQCIKHKDKSKMKNQHTGRLKEEFLKCLEKEKDIDRQLKEGKFNPPLQATTGTSNVPKTSDNQQPSSRTMSQQNQRQQSTAQQSTKTSQSSGGGGTNFAQQQQNQMEAFLRQMAANPTLLAAAMSAANPFATMGMGGLTPQQLFSWNQRTPFGAAAAAGSNPAAAANNMALALAMGSSFPNLGAMATGNTSTGGRANQDLIQQQLKNIHRQQKYLMDMMPKQEQKTKK